MARRSGKFYIRNEKELMRELGLDPTIGSGSGWLEKEDGQSEHIICQLKSTDKDRITVNLQDIRTLETNAVITHKIPVFIIQFLKTNEVFLISKLENIADVAAYIQTGVCDTQTNECWAELSCATDNKGKNVVRSSKKRDAFWEKKERERKKWQGKSKSSR